MPLQTGRAARMWRLLAVFALTFLPLLPLSAHAAPAQIISGDPRNLVLRHEDAGKAIMWSKDEEGSDDGSPWFSRRWERDRDNEDVRVGPIITYSKVWVSKDEKAARSIFEKEKNRQKDFPEASDFKKGPFKFEGKYKEGDDSAALSACIDCNATSGINLHHRIVNLYQNVVWITYIFGRESVSTTQIATYFNDVVYDRVVPKPVEKPAEEPAPQPEPAPASPPAEPKPEGEE
ncbi:MAG: hypothetical protein U0821_19645 [Chloroflexota bacterium]